mgnify:CR=1 FL=1
MLMSHDEFLLGCHLSIAKGVAQAIDEAESLGNNALQIFSHAPAAWRMKPLAEATVAGFRARRRTSAVRVLAVHTMYLLNLAGPDETLHRRSVRALIDEVQRAGRLGADLLVTHLGAHLGRGAEAGIDRVVAALDRLIGSPGWRAAGGLHLLLENTAGAGTTLGAGFDQLAEILNGVVDRSRVGVCLDTCHAFAAGYDLATPSAVDATLAQFDRWIGLDRLEMVHLNDARHPLGSRKDRHEHIGRGAIGPAGVAAIVRHPALADVPFVLETPKRLDGRSDADRINLAAVRRLREEEPS